MDLKIAFLNVFILFLFIISGSAVVIVSGLMTASRVTQKKISQNSYLFYGGGGVSYAFISFI